MEKLDLHGVTVQEALDKTRRQIEWATQHGVDVLVINHGKGYHSEHGIGVVRQQVRAYLKEQAPILRRQGYTVVYGESDLPVALEYDGGCTLLVMQGKENEYLGSRRQVEKSKLIYSREGRQMRKQAKRNRHRK